MKILSEISGKLSLIAFLSLLLVLKSSCVNDIVDKEDTSKGNIPITLATQLQPAKTRVTDLSFEENDAIGLFITIQPGKINQSRYADNIKFTCNASEEFTPSKVIYFPEEDELCDFTAYYPYTEGGLEKKTAKMKTGIYSDQSTWESYSKSNFMIAGTTGITSTEEPVELIFENKFSRINIQLKPQNGYTKEMLLEANPVVKIKNTHTKASYDFVNDEFSGLNTPGDVIPYGTWEAKEDVLDGKSVILVPQTMAASTTIVELTIGNKRFECAPNEELVLAEGTSRDIVFSIVPSSDGTKGNVSVSLKGWEVVPKKELELTEAPYYVNIPKVDFKPSSVYKVMNNGAQVAEICREYLLADNINAQAIVAYPMLEGKADFSNGVVCAILGAGGVASDDEIHGGKVSWDTADNTLTYLPGASAPINYMYVSADNKITTLRTENTLQVELQADKLNDIRGGILIEYPIVKIAAQYWMRGNMKTINYTDGSDIPLKSRFTNSSAGYATPNDTYYFYNSAALSSGILAPEGWRISNTSDWNGLRNYLKDNSSELRNGNNWGTTVTAGNLSGFNASAVGIYQDGYKTDILRVYYWSVKDSSPETVDKAIKISAQNDIIEEGSIEANMGLSVRCVRK